MRGRSTDAEALAKNPKVKRDALVGSENEKSLAASNGGMEEAPVAAKVGEVIMPNPKMYTLAELKGMTRNFKADAVLGEDRSRCVFKGWADERTLGPFESGSSIGIAVAIKTYDLYEDLGSCEWQSEVDFLAKFSHPNLVRLLGYCRADDQYLHLVYEFMRGGSLKDCLFSSYFEPLPWGVRLKIAVGAARGFVFLHTSRKKAIYSRLTSSKILLDANFNAKLSDFALEELLQLRRWTPQGVWGDELDILERDRIKNSFAAPEYICNRHLYMKSDVYSFGMVLLEMLTGLQAIDHNRPSGKQNLVDWVRPSLHDRRQLRKIMDPRLEGRYPLKAAFLAAHLILKCLEGDPKARPSMDEVLTTLEHINTIPEETKASASSRPSPHQHYHNHHRSPIHCNHSADSPGGSGSGYSPSAASRTH